MRNGRYETSGFRVGAAGSIAVLADSGAPAVPAWAARREWQVVRAVRERRFAVLGGSLFARPSPRAPQAVAALRRALAATR